MSSGDSCLTPSAARRIQPLIIETFSSSSDAPVMCFDIALPSFVVRSVLDSTCSLVVVRYIGAGIERWELQV
jgi:hypothetical protein